MIKSNQVASINGTQTRPTSFKAETVALESVQVLAMQYDQTKTLINENELYLLTSPEKTGADFGYNSQMYLAHKENYDITGGQLKTYACPIAEPASAEPSTGTFTFSGTTTENGTYTFYIHGERFTIPVVTTDTLTQLGDKMVTAINGSDRVLVTASNAVGVVTVTSTFKALTANEIRLAGSIVRKNDDLAPAGLTVAIVQPATGGAGVGDESASLVDAWEAIVSHPEWKTDVITPTGSTTALDLALSVIGLPEDGTSQGSGLWADADYKPCTNWSATIGDLSASLALAVNRKDDPDNAIITAPDYLELPFQIAVQSASYVGKSANSNPATKYEGANLNLIGALEISNDWTSGQSGASNIDIAVKGGLTPVIMDSNQNPSLADVTTTYRPLGASTPVFKFEVNKRKTWNVANSVKNDKLVYTNDVIVESTEEASNQSKATDADAEKARIVTMVGAWVRFGWVYNGTFTTSNMVVEVSTSNPDRIDRAIPILLSGNKRVMSDTILVDRNLNIADQAVVVKIG